MGIDFGMNRLLECKERKSYAKKKIKEYEIIKQ